MPTTLEGYRTVYRGHLADPDIQDARAWWPFVCIGDNHEFSWQGWQSTIKYNGKSEPAQPLRVAANQAWWEFIPSRVAKASGPGLERFDPPAVKVAPIERLDADGLGDEPNNRAAIASMTAYRAMRFGAHVELILTDMHSFTMEDPTSRSETDPLGSDDFPFFFPQEAMEVLDAGRAHHDNQPPETITFGKTIPNFRKQEPPMTILGREQKAWFKKTLAGSTATWKIWGGSNGTLDWRADPQNLPAGLAKTAWPGAGYACFGGGDLSRAIASAPSCTTSSATSGSRGSSRFRGTGTASGPGTRQRTFLPGPSSPSGSRSSAGPSRRPVWQSRSSMDSRAIRSGHCSPSSGRTPV